MAGLYIMSGIGGNLFSANVAYGSDKSVGASTADCGILPGFFALIILNWAAFDANPQMQMMRCYLVFMCILFSLMNVMVFSGGSIASPGSGMASRVDW